MSQHCTHARKKEEKKDLTVSWCLRCPRTKDGHSETKRCTHAGKDKSYQSHWPGSNLRSSSHGTPQNNTQFFIFLYLKMATHSSAICMHIKTWQIPHGFSITRWVQNARARHGRIVMCLPKKKREEKIWASMCNILIDVAI
jgi:hypothetical protein